MYTEIRNPQEDSSTERNGQSQRCSSAKLPGAATQRAALEREGPEKPPIVQEQ